MRSVANLRIFSSLDRESLKLRETLIVNLTLVDASRRDVYLTRALHALFLSCDVRILVKNRTSSDRSDGGSPMNFSARLNQESPGSSVLGEALAAASS